MRPGMLALVGGVCAVVGGGTAVSGSALVTISGVKNSQAPNSRHAPPIPTPTIAGQTSQIARASTGPTMSLDRARLQFAATTSDAPYDYPEETTYRTGSQTVRLLQSGPGTVTWTATPNAPWITVSPKSGTGAGTLSIDVPSADSLVFQTTRIGAVTLTLTGAANTIDPIVVEVTLMPNSEAVAPAGAVDTPADGATGLAGSIAVSGWAIDDIGVAKVELWRDPVFGEGVDLVFIGKAVLVDGARPDVAAAHPALPRNTMAGWGYLMLTNSLPFRGNGTFTIYAIATDMEGHATIIGSKTITCANDASIEPFGAIDTPAQGEVVSGSSYTNFGWVLANREIKAVPPDGGTVQAFIDGVEFAPPGGWTARQDLTALFPAASYSGVAHALGVTSFDTRTLTNGVHSISWVATASNGQRAGIGSRFFSVSNNTLMSGVRSALSALPDVDEVNRVPLARAGVVVGRRGYDLTAPLQTYPVDASGRATLWAEELDRIEVQLGAPGYTGYLRIGDRLGPLPIGSTIDAATGTFTWGVGVAFVHDYDLVFVRREHERLAQRQEVRISLRPKLSRRAGAQLVIDTPHVPASGDDPAVVQPFLVAGWAVDLGETVGTGIGTLHVWAFPVRPGHEPIFLGATAYGGARPDVSALYGERFKPSGYGLMVTSLSPGTYDLGVFAWSTVTGTFAPAKVVRVTVR